MHAGRREGHVEPRVAIERHPHGRPETPRGAVLTAVDRARQSRLPVLDRLAAVVEEETGPPRPRHREAEPHLSTDALDLAEIADRVLRPRVVRGDGPRDARLADARIGVREI